MKREHYLPLAPVEQMIRINGAKRVSDTATKELRDYLEHLVTNISQKAVGMAQHGKRITITKDDIIMAVK